MAVTMEMYPHGATEIVQLRKDSSTVLETL